MKLTTEIQDSVELRFSNLARRMNAEGRRIISLGLGEPGFPTPPPIIEAAAQAMRDGFTRYSSPFGLFELRQRIAAKLAQENGITASPDEIMVTPGAKMALSLVLGALLRPGDEIITVLPCYPSYLPQIKLAEPEAEIRAVNLSRGDFRLDLAALAAALTPRTRAVLLNYPNNPTGRMLSAEDLDGLVAVLADHPCWIISDEIYERLNFSGVTPLSPAARPELAGRVITINGFSKAFSMTGWRIGYLVAPETVMRTVSKLQQHWNTNTAPFIQKAACTALDLPADFLAGYNAQLADNHRALAATVARQPQLRLGPSQGGLFAFVDLSATGRDADGFCSGLIERHTVAATPGLVFGADWADHMRVSLACDRESFAEGMRRLELYLEEGA